MIVFKEKETGKNKKVMTLNHLGTDILRAFLEGKTEEELVPELVERYEATVEGMQEEVSKFYAELKEY